jgi:nucleoside-diphosphate-sugar epimerase
MLPDRLDEFLAADFARIGAGPIDRCMKLDGQRLFLTGATGFFGKNILSLLSHLERRGAVFRVTALSRSPERFLADEPWCRELGWLDWMKGDVGDPWPAGGNHDLMLHAATETKADAHRDRVSLFEQMLTATRNALTFAASHGVRRLLLTGSGAQYGAIPSGDSAGVAESSRIACDSTLPGSAYGEGKRASEMLAAIHGESRGFDVVNTRCFAFVGPGLPLDGHFAVGNFLKNALDGKPITLATRGEAVRSYLYGADLAVWLLVLLLEAGNRSIFNVGSDRAVRISDLASRIRDVVNPGVPVVPGTRPSDGERDFYVPSIARARALGLDAWTELDQAISRTASWHRKALSREAH